MRGNVWMERSSEGVMGSNGKKVRGNEEIMRSKGRQVKVMEEEMG